MMDQIQAAVLNLVSVAVVGMLGYAATQVGNFFRAKGIDQKINAKRQSVDIAVGAIEQIAKVEGVDVMVNGKFNTAKERAIEILTANGIKITEMELDSMIEESVKAMNDGFKGGSK